MVEHTIKHYMASGVTLGASASIILLGYFTLPPMLFAFLFSLLCCYTSMIFIIETEPSTNELSLWCSLGVGFGPLAAAIGLLAYFVPIVFTVVFLFTLALVGVSFRD